jgi:hypothetical protein
LSDARSIEAISTRLRALEDAEAIRRLKARYAELVDARYERGGPKPAAELERLAGEIAALFAEDAVWEAGGALGICQGRDAIRARMAEPTLLFSRHYFVNPRIEVRGDVATARWELLAPCTTTDGKPAWMAGVEDDAYARVGDAWLHTRMKLSVHFFAPHERGWGKR